MLAILTTHPIQYQVPLWQLLAKDGRVPFEVWYLSKHATERSLDMEFKQEFAWDIDMLSGYNYRLLRTPAGATPNTPFRTRITESLTDLIAKHNVKVLWINGWQVAAYWQAVWAAHRAGIQVWMRGESNILKECETIRLRDNETTGRKQGAEDRRQRSEVRGPWSVVRSPRNLAKRLLLGQLFRRVDHFLCIGTANRDLYRSYGVPESKLHMTMYAVDNGRFASQAEAIRSSSASAQGSGATGRSMVRSQWSIPEDAFCVLFCGKFIPKKHPRDLIKAAHLLLRSHSELKVHLLFAGSGELGTELREECDVMYDAEKQPSTLNPQLSTKPAASFTGFLNQIEVSRAYVAADCLVLPSDHEETWGLVVNEAMASELPCIISDRCGCAPDLGGAQGNAVFPFGDFTELAHHLKVVSAQKQHRVGEPPCLRHSARTLATLYVSCD